MFMLWKAMERHLQASAEEEEEMGEINPAASGYDLGFAQGRASRDAELKRLAQELEEYIPKIEKLKCDLSGMTEKAMLDHSENEALKAEVDRLSARIEHLENDGFTNELSR